MSTSSRIPHESSLPGPEAVDQVLAGEESAFGGEELNRWLAKVPERSALVAALRRTSAGGEVVSAPADVDRGLRRLQAKIKSGQQEGDSSASSSRQVRISQSRVRSSQRMMGVVAALVVIVAVMIPAIRRTSGPAGTATAPVLREYTAASGQRVHIELPDGSQAILGPATRLKYTASPQGRRVVELNGQAFFTVLHVTDRPFTVYARETVTQVLGTSFSVRAYATDQVTHVAVAEGRVAVGKRAEDVVLHAGDVGVITADGNTKVIHDASIADMFGWTRGHVAFRDVPMRDAVAELEREYNVTIRFGDAALGDRRITTTLVNAPLGEMISTIAPVIGAVGKVQGDTVTFLGQ